MLCGGGKHQSVSCERETTGLHFRVAGHAQHWSACPDLGRGGREDTNVMEVSEPREPEN